LPDEDEEATSDGPIEASSFPSELGCPYQRAPAAHSPTFRRKREDAREGLVRLASKYEGRLQGRQSKSRHKFVSCGGVPSTSPQEEEDMSRSTLSKFGLIPVQAPPGETVMSAKPARDEDEDAPGAGVGAAVNSDVAIGSVPAAESMPEQAALSPDSSPEALGGGVTSRFNSPSDTVIIFDWDDTLFPTWFISDVVVPCLPPGTKWDGDAVLPSDSPFAEALTKHAQTVRALLSTARKIGRVGIVTLAQRPWVLSSAKRFWPGLEFEAVLKELDIPIIYARECLRRPMISQAKVEEGVNIFTIAKQAAMLKALKKLYGRDPWKNVISIGDSIVERDAITEVLWGHDQDPEITPCCKTVKLMEEPSPEQLGAELTLLGMWLRSMAAHGEDFDVVMDDSEEMVLRMHERFCAS